MNTAINNVDRQMIDPFDMKLSPTLLSDLIYSHNEAGERVFHIELLTEELN